MKKLDQNFFVFPTENYLNSIHSDQMEFPKHMTIASRIEGLVKSCILSRIIVMVKKDILGLF